MKRLTYLDDNNKDITDIVLVYAGMLGKKMSQNMALHILQNFSKLYPEEQFTYRYFTPVINRVHTFPVKYGKVQWEQEKFHFTRNLPRDNK